MKLHTLVRDTDIRFVPEVGERYRIHKVEYFEADAEKLPGLKVTLVSAHKKVGTLRVWIGEEVRNSSLAGQFILNFGEETDEWRDRHFTVRSYGKGGTSFEKCDENGKTLQ